MQASSSLNLIIAIVAAVILVLFDFYSKFSWKWLAGGVFISGIILFLIPPLGLMRWFSLAIAFAEILAFYLACSLLKMKLKTWQAFLIAIPISFVWIIVLLCAVGIAFDL